MSTSSIATTRGAPPAAPRSSGRDRAVALALVLGAQLMIILDMTVVNVALPSIARDLHFSPTGLSWVLNAYTLPFGGLLLLGGRAGDILGRRRVFMAGLALFTVASLAGGLATSAGQLLAARVAQGAGGAVAIPAVLALITASFPEGRERTRALGLFTAVAMGGASLGLVLGGVHRPVGELALGAVRQCADRRAGAGARAAVPVRDPAPAGALRPGRGTVLDRRHVRAGVRVHPGRRGGLAGPAHPCCAGRCTGAARPVPAERGAGGAADHAAAAVRRPRARQVPTWPGCCSLRGMFGMFFLADPVRAG